MAEAEAELARLQHVRELTQASLTAIDTDIRKAIIRSPISGIVLDRQVDPGQTWRPRFKP